MTGNAAQQRIDRITQATFAQVQGDKDMRDVPSENSPPAVCPILLARAMAALPCAAFVTDKKGVIVWANAGLSALTHYAIDELVGHPAAIFRSGEQDPDFYQKLWLTILSGDDWRGRLANRRKDGALYYTDEIIAPIFDESGDITNFVAWQIDMTAPQRSQFEQQWLAYHDSLTRLPNRPCFMEQLSQAVANGTKQNGEFMVMFVDLDRFKPVNDQYGHHVGDLLLVAVANRMRAAMRSTDLVARLGGDEFTVIARHLANPEHGLVVGEKLIAALSRPFHLADHTIQIGASVGVAAYPADGTDAAVLLQHSDAAMYSAKSAGGNRVCLSSDLTLQQ
jgi:diguanylate cyclase (GGDEF)-like protein/PAS domain S-box-containing protein